MECRAPDTDFQCQASFRKSFALTSTAATEATRGSEPETLSEGPAANDGDSEEVRIQPSSRDTTACQLGSNGTLEIERAAPDVLPGGASITTEGERDVSSVVTTQTWIV